MPADRPLPEQASTPASVRSRAASGAVTVTLRNVALRALGLAGLLVQARLLEPREIGLLALGLAVVSVGHLISAGGFGADLIRRDRPPTSDELASVTGAQLLATSLIAGVTFVVTAAIGGNALVPGIMTLSLPLFVLRTPTIVMLERDLQFGFLARAQLIEVFAYNVVAVGLLFAGAGVWGVAVAAAAYPLLGSLLLIRGGPVGALRPRLDFGLLRSMLRFGIAFQSVQLTIGVRDQSVNVMIAAVAGTAALGIWSVAYRSLQVVYVLVHTAWSVVFSSMARLVETGEAPATFIADALRTSAVSVGLLACVVAGTAPALVPALFGDGWQQAVAVLPWGSCALMISGPVSIGLVGFLLASGAATRVLAAVSAEAVVWIALAAALLPALGPQAVGVGMLAGALTFALVARQGVRRLVTVAFVRHLISPFAAAALAAGAGWLVASSISTPAVGLLASGATTLSIYLACSLLLVRSDLFRLWHALANTVLRGRREAGFEPVA